MPFQVKKKLKIIVLETKAAMWVKDKSLADLDNLSDPDVQADEIVENLEAGLASFRTIILSLNNKK